MTQVYSQDVYITSTGGSYSTEKWMSITTGPNGSGTQVWGQGDGTYGDDQGLLSDETVDLTAYCGTTLYINTYDRYDDSWDGTTYEIWSGPGQTGVLLANNGGLTPDSGDDDDCNGSGWCTTDPDSEQESSEIFTVPACPCNFPVASYSVVPDCGNLQFTITVTVTSLGDGTGIDIGDGTTTYQSNVGVGAYYIGPFNAGTLQTILVDGAGYGGCSVMSPSLTEDCGIAPPNGSDAFSTTAPNILDTCLDGDLSSATVEGPTDYGPYCASGGVSGLSNNYIRNCSGSFDNETDFQDIWYQVDLPDGSNEMTLTVTGLGANEYIGYVLHTGNPVGSSGNNVATATSNYVCSFFSSSVTSHTITGLADESTAPIFIRILATNPNQGDPCSSIIHPASFTICATSPQVNDICYDALPIVDPSTFAPLTQGGDISLANVDGGSSLDNLTKNGDDCGGSTIATGEEDLWYTISTPATGAYYLNVAVDFIGAPDNLIILLEEYCASGYGHIGCGELTSNGIVVFNASSINNFGNELDANKDYNIRVLLPTGSTANTFTINAQLIAKNNSCDIANKVFPLDFTITNTVVADFSFSAATGIQGDMDPDLWYVFDPDFFNDIHGQNIYSTSADVVVSGLGTGEIIDLQLYKRHGSSGVNCSNYSSDYLSTTTISSNGTYKIGCLDEIHGTSGTGDGYIVRVLQTGGATTASPTITVTPSSTEPPFNNSCINIWDGNSPNNLGISNAAHGYNAYLILDGETVTGNFTGATDCDAEIASSLCSGISNAAFSSDNGRDMWYLMYVPAMVCPGLVTSTVIESMYINYDAGSSFKDGKIYVYSTCGDANLIDCSPTLDGSGDTWEATGLNQGEYYAIRVQPSSLNSDFNYTYTLTVTEGPARPCNNDAASAHSLSVNGCNDYDGLASWSMKGASKSAEPGVPENDVWFKFTAPDPTNGSSYFNANKSWVTVFFEHVSGASAGPVAVQLFAAPSMKVPASNTFTTTSTGGSQEWAHFGHLNPGQEYYLRLYHKDVASIDVRYKINIYTPDAQGNGSGFSAWECGMNGATLTSGCSEGCSDLRETYFRIDLPVGTPGFEYFMIEVVGDGQMLDFELRSQYLTESSANEGDIDDFDHPCSSRPLEPSVSITSETLGVTNPTSGESCSGGTGTRRVYFSMNGPAAGMKDFYYIRVFMDPSDPNYATTTGLNICKINFNGPYSTSTLANAGGTPDLECSNALPVELTSFEGSHQEGANELEWTTATEINNSHFLIQSSPNGKDFQTIETMDGKGTTNALSTYGLTDYRYYQTISYYRLMQVDYDGQKTVSGTIAVKSPTATAVIYPNPIQTGNPVTIESNVAISSYKVLGVSGAVILTHSVSAVKQFQLPTSSLKTGIYFVQIQGLIGTKTLRLVVN